MEYTCKDYRTEMLLLSLERRLHQENLSEAEKKAILSEIQKIRKTMGLD